VTTDLKLKNLVINTKTSMATKEYCQKIRNSAQKTQNRVPMESKKCKE
jgi:hypothetical protein